MTRERLPDTSAAFWQQTFPVTIDAELMAMLAAYRRTCNVLGRVCRDQWDAAAARSLESWPRRLAAHWYTRRGTTPARPAA